MRASLIFLALSATGCSSRPHVFAMDATSSPVPPPATIAFDDVEFVKAHPRVYTGPHGCFHTARCECLSIPGCTMTCDGAKSPCCVDSKAVFQGIPEYMRIQLLNLGEQDSEYWLLITRANDAFLAALRAALKRWHVYDAVFEAGDIRLRAHTAGRGIPDITASVIEALRRKP